MTSEPNSPPTEARRASSSPDPLQRIVVYLRRFFSAGIRFALVCLVLLLVGISIAIYLVERGHNPDVHVWTDGFRWTWENALDSGPWDPVTEGGRWIYYFMLFLQPAIAALFTAVIASKLIEILLRKSSGQGKAKVHDHIVICGWSSKGKEIIDEIDGRDDPVKAPIVVLAPLKASPSDDGRFTFISGDPTRDEDLRRAGIDRATTAIVLADNSYPDIDSEEMDSRTLLTTLAIESVNPNCYTCVEVVKSENREHFSRAKADELLVSGRLAGAMLAHSAVTRGLSRVVGDLITHPEGNEFYWVSVPERMAGTRFDEALTLLKREYDCVPIAVAPADDAHDYTTNPPPDYQLRAKERLLVIASRQPMLA